MNNQIEVEVNGKKVTITLTDEQINQLQKATQGEWWEEIKYPRNGELNAAYGYINDYRGSNLGYSTLECVIDYADLSRRMTFNNIEQARIAAEYINLFTEMYNFAQLRNGNNKIDLSDYTQCKFGVYYRNPSVVGHYDRLSPFVFGIAFLEFKYAEEAVQIFGDRIKEVYSKLQNY